MGAFCHRDNLTYLNHYEILDFFTQYDLFIEKHSFLTQKKIQDQNASKSYTNPKLSEHSWFRNICQNHCTLHIFNSKGDIFFF